MATIAQDEGTRRHEPGRRELAGFAGPGLLAQACDERLAELVRDGDENAFAAIVARYRAPLERHCRRTLPPSRAEDALQQTFASAYVALAGGARPASLRPWLYAIAHNTALNGLRDRQLESLDLAGEIGERHQPHEILARRESLQSVVHAVAGLPSRQRQVIVRQEFEGQSQEQIASELGLTRGAVRQLAHRARSTVRAAAAALLPAPLWQRIPWLVPTGGGELVVSSALGAIVGKAAVVLLMAGAASGAVQLTVAHPSASRPAHTTTVAPNGDGGGAGSAAVVGSTTAAGALGAGDSATTGGRGDGPPSRGTAAAGAPVAGGHGAAGAAGPTTAAGAPAGSPAADEASSPDADRHGAPAAAGADDSPAADDSPPGAGKGTSGSGSAASANAPETPATAEDDLVPDVADAPDPPDVAEAEAGAPGDAADIGPSGVNRGSTPPAATPAPAPAAPVASASGASG
jgi:RNA polymerase sigma factor (sigma-70 family)